MNITRFCTLPERFAALNQRWDSDKPMIQSAVENKLCMIASEGWRKRKCQDLISHTRTVLSKLPEARYFPSGDQLTELTLSMCPRHSYTSLLERASWIKMARSSFLCETRYLPSGEDGNRVTPFASLWERAITLRGPNSYVATTLNLYVVHPTVRYLLSMDQETEHTRL